jgi:protein-disulfide isomerase
MRRRQLLGTLGVAGVAGLAGCTGGDGGAGDTGGSGEDTGGSGGDTDGGGDETGGSDGDSEPWSLPDHPALTGIESEPALGPAPGEAPALVVGFEDPSCITCQRFETGTFPKLESELVSTGKLTFSYRVFPITYPWGEPASQALEATYAAAVEAGAGPDAPAFWGLKDHYYAERDRFGTDNVYDLTESYLAAETELDATAVVEGAREGRHSGAVQTDVDAGNAAGVSSTPTFYLFREGEFQTTVRGAQSYDVFAAALGF